LDKDYEYEYELLDFDNGKIVYPGSGYVSPYQSEYKPHHERTTKPQHPQKTEEELINEKEQQAEKVAMSELIALRNKSTVTAAVTIKTRHDTHHPKKPITEEKALQMAMKWWDKKNPEFSYIEFPLDNQDDKT